MTRSLDTIQDEILVLAAQEGDAGAFGALLRRWLPVMRRHAARLTGDASAADDVAQEACLALVGALGRLVDPARARGWMLRIVTHKAADWARRRRRDRTLIHAIHGREPRPMLGEPWVGDSPERAELVRSACLSLSIDERALVSLYYGEGMPIALIAECVGIAPGAVKSRLHVARARLKAILGKELA